MICLLILDNLSGNRRFLNVIYRTRGIRLNLD